MGKPLQANVPSGFDSEALDLFSIRPESGSQNDMGCLSQPGPFAIASLGEGFGVGVGGPSFCLAPALPVGGLGFHRLSCFKNGCQGLKGPGFYRLPELWKP